MISLAPEKVKLSQFLSRNKVNFSGQNTKSFNDLDRQELVTLIIRKLENVIDENGFYAFHRWLKGYGVAHLVYDCILALPDYQRNRLIAIKQQMESHGRYRFIPAKPQPRYEWTDVESGIRAEVKRLRLSKEQVRELLIARYDVDRVLKLTDAKIVELWEHLIRLPGKEAAPVVYPWEDVDF